MACTTLTVVDPVPVIRIVEWGFAEVEGENRKFEDPCTEADIIGLAEAVWVRYSVAKSSGSVKTKFKLAYMRPGDVVKTQWSFIDERNADGTHEIYGYSTDHKYKKGNYTGLTVGTEIVSY